jgi:hypothetical protein
VKTVSPDSCYLALLDYEVLSGCSLQVQPPTFSAASGETESSYPLMCVDGRTVEGKRAFYNDDDRGIYVDVVPSRFELGQIDCKVHFSVPRVVSGRTNYHGTDQQGTEEAMRAVEAHLREIGIATNIGAARLSRLDTFRNVVADEPYSSYRPVMELLKGNRMQEREFQDGYLWANSQWQICAYDKLAEMRAKNRRARVDNLPANTIRFEKRLLNHRKIESVSGLGTVADLLEGFDTLTPEYEKAMKSALFKGRPKSRPVLTVAEAEAGMRHFKERGDRYWADAWLNALGMSRILELAEIETVMCAVENVADNRMAKVRMKSKLEQLHLDAAVLQTLPTSKRTLGELYSELRAKVLSEPLRLVA